MTEYRHLYWTYPGTGARLMWAKIEASATDAVKREVMAVQYAAVRRIYGEEVADTLGWTR